MTTEFIGVAYRITAVVIKTTSTVDMNEWDACGNSASTISISCNSPDNFTAVHQSQYEQKNVSTSRYYHLFINLPKNHL